MPQAIGSLYSVPDYRQRSLNTYNQSANTMSRQQAGKTTHTESPGKTAGGAIMSGVGGLVTGASLAGMEAMAPVVGALGGPAGIIGGMTALGLGSYLLS